MPSFVPADVDPGEGQARFGGTVVPLQTSRVGDELVVTVGRAKIVIGASDVDGQTANPSGEDTLQLVPGGEITIRSEGFEPFSEAEGWLFSDPVRLGSATANDAGRVEAGFVIPDSVPVGSHRFGLKAVEQSGQPIEMTLGVEVVRREAASVQWTVWIVVAVVGAGIASALFLPSAIRRRREV